MQLHSELIYVRVSCDAFHELLRDLHLRNYGIIQEKIDPRQTYKSIIYCMRIYMLLSNAFKFVHD
jgi:hypothetical protein